MLGVALPEGAAARSTRSRTSSPASSTGSPACSSRSPPTSPGLPAALIAAGSIVGGQLGATYGRRLSPDALRGLIVVVGLAAIAQLVS